MENYCTNSLVYKMPCGHYVHRTCGETWFSLACTCPVCRYDMIDECYQAQTPDPYDDEGFQTYNPRDFE